MKFRAATILCLLVGVATNLSAGHQLVGCFKDRVWPFRAISYSGKTFSGSGAVQKCAEIAVTKGYQAFGVQDGGECYTGPKAHQTYNKYGQADDSDCKNGLGGWYRNNVYSIYPESTCGQKPHTRIVGGDEAPRNSWPWQAMVKSSTFCGGSLIAPEWVVTAAHCVSGESSSDFIIRLGAHEKRKETPHTQQEFEVAKIITHPEYDKPSKESNDIALIKLKRPALFTHAVRPVCLSDSRTRLPFDNPGKECWVTGWGKLSSGGPSPTTLQQASIPLVSREKCAKALGSLDDSMLCAGDGKGQKDTCQGDSGGPLVCEYQGKWHLEGATSWGIGCALEGYYGVYANIRHVRDWLTKTMASN